MKPRHSRLRRARLFPVLLLALSALFAAAAQAGFDHRHLLLDEVLRKYVDDGLVNYRALKADPDTLNRYLHTLAEADARDYPSWTHQQQLAFWINTYNACTLRAILDHYPIRRSLLADPLRRYPSDSIRQIPGVWNRLRWRVLGRELTLDYMEHTILRRELAEPRIHFVLVCASKGCPLLESRAFDAEHLDARLDQAARNYLYRDRKIRIDRAAARVSLPQIFNWFSGDFTADPDTARYFTRFPRAIAGPLGWVYRYADAADRDFLRHGNFAVDFIEYDWNLNERH